MIKIQLNNQKFEKFIQKYHVYRKLIQFIKEKIQNIKNVNG